MKKISRDIKLFPGKCGQKFLEQITFVALINNLKIQMFYSIKMSNLIIFMFFRNGYVNK